MAPARDLAFVAQVLQGDEVAAAALVERLRPLILTVVRRRLPRRVDEADLVQTVYLRVFTKLDQYSGKSPLEHWVSRLALRTCLNEIRYERNRPELRRADLSPDQDRVVEFLSAAEEEFSPHQRVAAKELVEKLLDQLPSRESVVMSMLHLEGHSLREVHESTGWSMLAVRLVAFRARKRMKKALEHLLKESLP